MAGSPVVTVLLLAGLPAAGKTTRARALAAEHHALRLTSNEWMIPLFGESEGDGKRDVLERRLISLAVQAVGRNGMLCWTPSTVATPGRRAQLPRPARRRSPPRLRPLARIRLPSCIISPRSSRTAQCSRIFRWQPPLANRKIRPSRQPWSHPCGAVKPSWCRLSGCRDAAASLRLTAEPSTAAACRINVGYADLRADLRPWCCQRRLGRSVADGDRHVRDDRHRGLNAAASGAGRSISTAACGPLPPAAGSVRLNRCGRAHEGRCAVLCVRRAPSALRAALEGQRRLAEHQWPADSAVRVRMGIHSGEGRLLDGDYVGLDTHRTARITDAGHSGQVVLSDAARALAAAALPPGATLRDLGEHRLKDLEHPERLFQWWRRAYKLSFHRCALWTRDNTTFLRRSPVLSGANASLLSLWSC